jgi:hypothetical protein
VNRLGQQPGILDVAISNPKGEVRFASHPNDLGDEIPTDHASLDRPTTHLMVDAGGRPILRSVNPVHNKPPCQECHGPMDQNPVTDILYVDFDRGPLKDQARTTTLLLISTGALIALVNLGGRWWFI